MGALVFAMDKSRFCQVFFPILFVGILLIISMPFATGYLETISSYYFGFLCLLWLLVTFKVLTYRNKNINDFLISIFGYFFLLSFFASLFYMTINPGIFIFTIINFFTSLFFIFIFCFN